MKKQIESPFSAPQRKTGVSLRRALNHVHPDIRRAVKEASRAYSEAGVPHMLVGGLAVGAHGYMRATADVDFVVGDEAFTSKGLIVSFAPGVPLAVGDVAIDNIPLDDVDGQLLGDGLDRAELSDGVPVAPVEVIVLMKLRLGRMKDKADIVELLKAGADVEMITEYINDNAPELALKLYQLTEEV